ncbi:MAG: carboxypeptidase regulatory-like domain-containing protein, partial [Acidobacteria bacterium]|nr:carboxypeptidase regulatory-like domain-containing protein [Acidobacteriota bacterium]
MRKDHGWRAERLGLSLTIFLLFISQCAGQTTFGSITGTVTDPSGAVVPDASVTVTNEGTGIARKVTTGAGGVFNVPNLDLGTYRVTIAASGFARYERGGLILSTNQVLNVDAGLELATTATVTEVRAATTNISTETSSLTDVKTNQILEQLPLEMSRHLADKGFYTYTFLNTGTSSVTYTSIPVINGIRTQSGTLPTMDGIAVTAYSGGASPVQPSFEAIQEV